MQRMHRCRDFLLLLGLPIMVSSSDAGTSHSANYSISSGSLNMGGRPSSSASYSNVGFISVQKTDDSGRPTASAGEGDSRIELRQTGFRLVTKLAIKAEERPPPSKPQILDLISHQNLQIGEPISLLVKTAGLQPMTFQWYFGRDPIDGETSHKLSIPNANASHAGTYRVLVRNSLGYRWSNKVYVKFLEPPVISIPPLNQTVVFGKTILLFAEAEGSPRLRYQWYRNNELIPRANRNVLRLKALSEFEGAYHVQVSNDVGTATSPAALVKVHRPPYFQLAPRSQSATLGEEVIFSVQASGKDTSGSELSYQWYKGREKLDGETSDTLVFSSVSEEDAGVYVVEISNELGTLKSRPFRLHLQYPPEILREPREVITREGGKAYFYVKVKGSRTLRYQWYKDGEPIRRANRNRLRIYPVKSADAGIYHVIIQNQVGSVESDPVSLVINEASSQESEPPDWKASFTRWTVLEDLLEEELNPEIDLDNDGIPNLLEYAFYGNPLEQDLEILPKISHVGDIDEKSHSIAITWREASEATNLTFTLQSSSDLKSWDDISLADHPISRTEIGTHAEVTVYLMVFDESPMFYRVWVSGN